MHGRTEILASTTVVSFSVYNQDNFRCTPTIGGAPECPKAKITCSFVTWQSALSLKKVAILYGSAHFLNGAEYPLPSQP